MEKLIAAGDSPWVKSSLNFSNSNCVEVANLPDRLLGACDSTDLDLSTALRPLPIEVRQSYRNPDSR